MNSLNKISIDKITFLLETDIITISKNKERKREFIADDINFILNKYDLIEKGYESEGYEYHYKLKGGVDFQFLPKYPFKKKKYHESTVDGHDRILIFYAERTYIFRFEYNPNKDYLSKIQQLLTYIVDNYRVNAKTIKISRIDVAIDYPLDMNLSLVSTKSTRKTHYVISAKGIDYVRFGSRNSNYLIRLYNKKEEIEKKQKEVCEHDSLYRIELEYKKDFFLQQKVIENIFDSLNFYESIEKTGNEFLDLLFFKAEKIGFDSVINDFSRQKKYRLKKKLENYISCNNFEHPAKIFAREFSAIWSNWKNQLYDIINVSYEGYSFETV